MEIIIGLVTLTAAIYFLSYSMANWISKDLDGYSTETVPVGGSHLFAAHGGSHAVPSPNRWAGRARQEPTKTLVRSTHSAQLSPNRSIRDVRYR